jgi:hypothetical protein
MNCSSLYDLTEQGFGQWGFLTLSLGLAGLGAIFFIGGKAFSHAQSLVGWIAYLTLRIGGVGFAVSWLIIGVFQTYQGYLLYRNLLEAVKSGQLMSVQGVVTEFSPYGSKPSPYPKESFTVNGKTFTYSPSEIRPGFNQAQQNGGPIHDGALVRVGYIDGVIIRLEICQSNDKRP